MQRDGHVHEELRQLTRRLRIPSGRAGRRDLRRGQRMRAGAKRDGEGLLGSHTSIPDHRRERHGAAPALRRTAQVVVKALLYSALTASPRGRSLHAPPPIHRFRHGRGLPGPRPDSRPNRVGSATTASLPSGTTPSSSRRRATSGGCRSRAASPQRLTTPPGTGVATQPISPDGSILAFAATYEGPTEVYTVSLAGRRAATADVGWQRRRGRRLDAGRQHPVLHASASPRCRTISSSASTRAHTCGSRVPLAQAADGTYDSNGRTLFFTRLPFQGSHTKRYQGGTAQIHLEMDAAPARPRR